VALIRLFSASRRTAQACLSGQCSKELDLDLDESFLVFSVSLHPQAMTEEALVSEVGKADGGERSERSTGQDLVQRIEGIYRSVLMLDPTASERVTRLR